MENHCQATYDFTDMCMLGHAVCCMCLHGCACCAVAGGVNVRAHDVAMPTIPLCIFDLISIKDAIALATSFIKLRGHGPGDHYDEHCLVWDGWRKILFIGPGLFPKQHSTPVSPVHLPLSLPCHIITDMHPCHTSVLAPLCQSGEIVSPPTAWLQPEPCLQAHGCGLIVPAVGHSSPPLGSGLPTRRTKPSCASLSDTFT